MNSDQWESFSEQARSSRADLWPGTVTIDGEDYEVSLTPSSLRPREREGGIAEEVTIAFELSKTDYETEPIVGDAVTFEEDEYSIVEVDGLWPSDPAWFVRASRWPD